MVIHDLSPRFALLEMDQEESEAGPWRTNIHEREGRRRRTEGVMSPGAYWFVGNMLEVLSDELLVSVAAFLSIRDLGRLSRVARRFAADCMAPSVGAGMPAATVRFRCEPHQVESWSEVYKSRPYKFLRLNGDTAADMATRAVASGAAAWAAGRRDRRKVEPKPALPQRTSDPGSGASLANERADSAVRVAAPKLVAVVPAMSIVETAAKLLVESRPQCERDERPRQPGEPWLRVLAALLSPAAVWSRYSTAHYCVLDDGARLAARANPFCRASLAGRPMTVGSGDGTEAAAHYAELEILEAGGASMIGAMNAMLGAHPILSHGESFIASISRGGKSVSLTLV